MNGDKGATLKGPSVMYPIMGMRREDKGIQNARETERSCVGGKTQTIYYFCLNTGKLEVTRDFFPGKNL